MKSKTYAGMGTGFQAHDAFATASQGAIQDRTDEHLSFFGQSYRRRSQVDGESDQRHPRRTGATPRRKNGK